MRVPHYRQYDISNYSGFGQHLFLLLYVVIQIDEHIAFTRLIDSQNAAFSSEICRIDFLLTGFWNPAGIADLFLV